jgi:preprotein translocase subunit Sec63
VLERAKGGARRVVSWHDRRASAREILGVEAAASPETIRRAYLELIRMWHPDRFPNDPSGQRMAEGVTKSINAAYEALYPPRRPWFRAGPPSRQARPHAGPARIHRSHTYASPSWEQQRSFGQLIILTLAVLIWLVASALLFYALAQWV